YLAELETVREQGYGVDDQENQLAGRCVAVPLAGLPVPAAISVSAPAGRLPAHEVRHVAQQLRRAAEEIVRALRECHRSGHPPASSPRLARCRAEALERGQTGLLQRGQAGLLECAQAGLLGRHRAEALECAQAGLLGC